MFTLSMEEAAACGVDSAVLDHLAAAGVPRKGALAPRDWAPRGVWGRQVLSVWCTIAPLDPLLLRRLQLFALSEAASGLDIIEGCMKQECRPREALEAAWACGIRPDKETTERARAATHALETLHARAKTATSALLRCEERAGTDAADQARIALAMLGATLTACSSTIAANSASSAWLVRETAVTLEDAWDELGVLMGRARPLPDDPDGAGALILARFVHWLERDLPAVPENPVTPAQPQSSPRLSLARVVDFSRFHLDDGQMDCPPLSEASMFA